MTITPTFICLLLAFICFLLAAFGVSARVGWRDLGFALVTLAVLLGGWRL